MLITKEKTKSRGQETIDRVKEYRDNNALNYSFLKDVIENNTKVFKPTIHTILGSALDTLLTSEECFEDLYEVKEFNRPGGDLIEALEEYTKESLFENYSDCVKEIAELAIRKGYGKGKSKLETVVGKIEAFEWYWDILQLSKTKEIITAQEYKNCRWQVNKIKTDSPISDWFKTEVIYQQPIYAEYEVNGVMTAFKGLPDLIFPEMGTFVDLKRTSYNIKNWTAHARKSYYQWQISLYYDILKCNGYDLKPYWLVVNNKIYLKPVSENDIEYGRTGVTKVDGYLYSGTGDKGLIEQYHPGYHDAVNIYHQAMKCNLLDYDLEYFRTNGLMEEKSIFG